MAKSSAATVAGYLRELPTERRAALAAVRAVVRKNHNAFYLTGVYQDPSEAKRLKDAFRKAGKRLDVGKSCLRFQKPEDLELEVIGEIISRTPPDSFIARYKASRRGRSSGSTRKSGRGRPTRG